MGRLVEDGGGAALLSSLPGVPACEGTVDEAVIGPGVVPAEAVVLAAAIPEGATVAEAGTAEPLPPHAATMGPSKSAKTMDAAVRRWRFTWGLCCHV